MGLLLENSPYNVPRPQQQEQQQQQQQPQQPQSTPAQPTPVSAPKTQEAPRNTASQLAVPAEVTKLWVDGVIQGGIFFHMKIRSDEPLPPRFTLHCVVSVTQVGLFNKTTPILRADGPHTLSVVTSVDGKRTPKVKRLDDGGYETECSLEYTGSELLHPGKRGAHRFGINLSGGALAEAFHCQDEFKV